MKIGILTYFSIPNFGANLQAYSTFEYLKKNGHEPLIIYYIPKELELGYKKGNPEKQVKAHEDFIAVNLEVTKKCRNTEEVISVIESNNIEAVLIGSDAVLQHIGFLARMYITKKGIRFRAKRSNLIFPNPFWGDFIKQLSKRIPVSVLSASSQNTKYKLVRGKKRKLIGQSLLEFDQITVRDDWTKKMVNYFTKGKLNPEITPDPVFGFNSNITTQISKSDLLLKYALPENYVLFSFKHENKVTTNWLKSCQKILLEKGYNSVYLTMPGGIIFKDIPFKAIEPPLDPLDWYSLIKHSSGYIGENMHPVIVALHNSVPCFSFDSYGIVKFKYKVLEKSSKIYHILEKGGFIDNRVTTLGRTYSPPDPELVVDRLLNFDIEKCKTFSNLQLSNYNDMMKRLINY